jgi:hypothetical protein
MSRAGLLLALMGVLSLTTGVLMIAAHTASQMTHATQQPEKRDASVVYVGSETCFTCHRDQHEYRAQLPQQQTPRAVPDLMDSTTREIQIFRDFDLRGCPAGYVISAAGSPEMGGTMETQTDMPGM